MKLRNKGFTLIELIIAVVIVGIVVAVIGGNFYGYIFSEKVTGELVSVTSAAPDGGMVVGNNTKAAFSSAVMLKQKGGAYVTFSTEDRQWASLRDPKFAGKCITAKVFPYAPWNFGKSGTYYNGRLLTVADACPG